MSPGISDVTAKVGQLDNAVNGVKGSLISMGGALGIAFGAAGVAMFAQKVVSAGTIVEDATTGLTTLLKDAGAAAMVVNNTMEDATKTPFAFEGLLSGNKALISAGASAKQAREDVLNLGNAIAATGGGDVELQRMVINMQQIKNTGQATAMDIKQFGFAGINIYKVLADATGKSMAQVKNMSVSYETLTMALKKAHEQGGIYYKGLENMAQNTSVRISNVGDALFQKMNSVFVELKPVIDSVLNASLAIISAVGGGLLKIISFIKQHITLVSFLIGTYVAYKGIMLGLLAVEKMIVAWKGISAVATQVLIGWDLARAEGMGVVTAAQWALNAAMNANPIGLIVLGIAALIAGVMALVNHFGSLGNAVKQVWEIMKAFVVGVAKAYWGLGEVLAGAFTFNPALIKKGLSDTVVAVKGAVTEISAAWNNTGAKAVGKTNIPGKDIKGKAGVAGAVGASATAAPKTKAEGQKNINIHIAYNASLIDNFTISTTNIKEGLGSLKDKVSAILVGATHDALIVADY